jgi:hypothetical protein
MTNTEDYASKEKIVAELGGEALEKLNKHCCKMEDSIYKISAGLNSIDYSVQFTNIQRVVHNIPEPWKTELTDIGIDLQEAIQEDLKILKSHCNW